jgi:hypothetical protein
MDPFEELKFYENNQETPLFVHYNKKTGSIIHVRNYLEYDKHPFIQVTQTQVLDDVTKYHVDITSSPPTLLKVADITDSFSTNIESISKYEKITTNKKVTQRDYKFDLLIEQDDIAQQFRIRLSTKLKKQFGKLHDFNETIKVYVTEENDPNILHQTLKFNIKNLINATSFIIAYNNFNGGDCSLYGYEHFATNLHIEVKPIF